MDFSSIYHQIEAATKDDVPLATAMRQVIDDCARQRPHADWAQLTAMDFDADFGRLRVWLRRLLEESPLPVAATGLWFGLFNPVDDDDQMLADLYVTAGVHDPDDLDWRCAPTWLLDGRYADSQLLAELCRIAYTDRDDQLGNDAEYPIALAYACLAVRDLVREFGTAFGPTERAVFVGFDSGDLMCIGAIAPTGLRFSTASDSLR